MVGDNYTLKETLTTHRCNATDKSILASDDGWERYENILPKFVCLDNPKKLNLRSGSIPAVDRKALWIEALYCDETDK